MSIDSELLAFAGSRAPWLRDSLRRICTQSDLSPTDTQEVFSNLKSMEGLDTAGQMQHLDASHLASRTANAHLALKGVNVSDDDYRKVFFAMKKASEFSGHDRPAARQPTPRSKAEMDNDVGEIWSYEKEVKKRGEQLAAQMRSLENPPIAVTTPPSAP